MEQELIKYKEEIESTKDALEHQELIGKVLIDKMHKVEEDSVKFAKIASEAREEVKRVKQTAVKTEEEKVAMEKMVLSFEEISRRVQKGVETRSIESDNLKSELNEAILAERVAKDKLLQALGDPIVLNDDHCYSKSQSPLLNSPNIFSPDIDESSEIVKLKYKMEQDQIDYIVKSGYLNEQMTLLRQQMESLKIREMMSLSDIQHEAKVGKGENKYSTINKVKEGTTRNRIAFFEEL